MNAKYTIVALCLAACDLGPRVADAPDAAPPPDAPDAAPPDAFMFSHVLPPGADVPSVSTNAGLLFQIRTNDGLPDAAQTVPRGTGKAGGATVRFWNFGPTPVDSNIAVAAPLYVLGVREADTFTPLADHPRLIDTIPGDTRYSALRRVLNVAVTDLYNGERIASLAALNEAIEHGLVTDPVPDGTWVNLPVVLPGITLEVAAAPAPAHPSIQVYGHGYLIDVFELGTSLGRQPLRNGFIPIGQSSSLLSGVPTGTPPALPTTPDPSPVFQFAIPATPPTTTPNYTPIANDLSVRLADGVAPSAITNDAELFRRSATGAITGYYPATVETYTVTTTINNLQLQFTEGSP